ncbi:hypothetical protein NVP1121O_183 [Vibrio phage 1.121.O._10N.286.46.C4]|nr:hypothetical protein NVP1121O_183 [Vibrio phage 1.121.O._10N.286.46.C4]
MSKENVEDIFAHWDTTPVKIAKPLSSQGTDYTPQEWISKLRVERKGDPMWNESGSIGHDVSEFEGLG